MEHSADSIMQVSTQSDDDDFGEEAPAPAHRSASGLSPRYKSTKKKQTKSSPPRDNKKSPRPKGKSKSMRTSSSSSSTSTSTSTSSSPLQDAHAEPVDVTGSGTGTALSASARTPNKKKKKKDSTRSASGGTRRKKKAKNADGNLQSSEGWIVHEKKWWDKNGEQSADDHTALSSSSTENGSKSDGNGWEGWPTVHDTGQQEQQSSGMEGLAAYGSTALPSGTGDENTNGVVGAAVPGSYLLMNGSGGRPQDSPLMTSSAAWLQEVLTKKDDGEEDIKESFDWFGDDDEDYEDSVNSEEEEEIAKRHMASLRRISFGIVPGLTEESLDLGLDYKEINHKELRLDETPIGRGQFGTVYRGTWRGAKVAVKRLHIEALKEGDVAQLRHEASLMSRLANHPNIVNFVGAVTISPHFCLVTAYYPNGSVKDYLDEFPDVPWKRIVSFARDAAAGILHLHYEHVIHRDIAARNLLIDENYSVAVADFGLSRTLATANLAAALSEIGPVAYMAPESIVRHQYSIKSDSFSFGVLLWELETRENPYSGMMLLDIALGVAMQGLRLPIRSTCPPVFVDLMKRCWEADPALRPDFVEIYSILDRYLLKVNHQHKKQKAARKEIEEKERKVKETAVRFLMPSPSFHTGPTYIRETTGGLVVGPTSPEIGGRRFSSPSIMPDRKTMRMFARTPLAMSATRSATVNTNSRPGSPLTMGFDPGRSKSEDQLMRHLDKDTNSQTSPSPPFASLQSRLTIASSAPTLKKSESDPVVSPTLSQPPTQLPIVTEKLKPIPIAVAPSVEPTHADVTTNTNNTTTPASATEPAGSERLTVSVPKSQPVPTPRVLVPALKIPSISGESPTRLQMLSPRVKDDVQHGAGEALERLQTSTALLDPWMITAEEIVKEYPLLHSASSTISKGKYRKNQIQPPVAVAIKRIRLYPRGSSVDLLAATRNEAMIFVQASQCKYIVPFVGVCLDPSDPFIATSWVANGSLSKLRQSLGTKWWRRLRHTKPLLLVRIAHDIASACAHLHKHKIIHRNLTPSNILLDKYFHARVSGLSAARTLDKPDERTIPFRAHLLYRAPELDWQTNSTKKETPAADVYSFSVLLWTLWTGKGRPYEWHAKNESNIDNMCSFMKQLENRSNDGDVWPIPRSMPEDWRVLMRSCANTKPELRPTFVKILDTLGKMWNDWTDKPVIDDSADDNPTRPGTKKRTSTLPLPRLGRQISEDVLPTPRARQTTQSADLIRAVSSSDELKTILKLSPSGSPGSSGERSTTKTLLLAQQTALTSISATKLNRGRMETPNGAVTLPHVRRSRSSSDLSDREQPAGIAAAGITISFTGPNAAVSGVPGAITSSLPSPRIDATLRKLRRLNSARTIRDTTKPEPATLSPRASDDSPLYSSDERSSRCALTVIFENQ
eukprot:TRINITY_DN6220_c0_g1_i1.p1 TRINITY_DN6220_c0_g1~~TRINITY_DN6220_c0_g1_i1.p1  ORF type:complete len:1407 (-),score=218.11 TRINITY_DN6220_c0_g1_i1:15-4235(-)